VGYITADGEIVALGANCVDNQDGSYTCTGDGPGFGSYLVYSYDQTTVLGCTETDACNYDLNADLNDGSCLENDDYGICGGNNDGDGTCVDSPIDQNTFTMLSAVDDNLADNYNVMQALYHSTGTIVGFQFDINWCSNTWLDSDQDGTPDAVLDFVCPDGYVLGSSEISTINQIGTATDNWLIEFDNQPTYTRIVGAWIGIEGDELTEQNIINPGCGTLFTATYSGNIHSITTAGFAGPGAVDLGFSYDECLDCEGYLDAEYPEMFILNQNYPNPFNPITNIDFTIYENGFVNLSIYDIRGRHIDTIVSEFMLAGTHNVQWNALNTTNKRVPSGIYIYQLSTNDMVTSKRMTLLK
jgi:hypothetical protein